MPAPFGDGLFAYEPPAGHGLNITDLFHIVIPKPGDPGNDSKVDTQYKNVAIITPDSINNRFGGMWAKEQLDLSLPFYTEIYLHLGHRYNKNATVADGMTFTLHNDPSGIDAIGGAGEGLGVYRGRKWTGEYWNGYPVTETHGTYLRNSLVIEFDTYRNLISDGAFVNDPAGSDPAHCALLIPKAPTILESDHKNVYFFNPSQRWIRFEVKWTPDKNGGGVLDYTFDGNEMSYQVNNTMSIFQGKKVYWGFTGATGYYTSVQAAAITKLPEQGITVEKTVKNEAGEDIDKGTALPGDILNYTVRVTARTVTDSIGPVVINDAISEYVDYTSEYVKVRTKAGEELDVMSSYSGNVMTVYTGQLLNAEDDWIEIIFPARVKEDAAGRIIYNKAEISAEGIADTQDTNTTEVRILADDDPVKSVSDESAAGRDGSAVKLGDVIIYDIAYINYDAAAARIIITDVLPEGLDFDSATDGGNYDDVTRTVTWSIPDVAAGEDGVVSLQVHVNEYAVVKIENKASVTVGGNEPKITNIVKNPVTPEAPEKKVSDSSAAGKGGSAVKSGDIITYEITYLNYEETAAKIVIIDELPSGTEYVSSSDNGDYDGINHAVSWTLTDVPSSGEGIVSVVVRVTDSAVVKLENGAAVQVGDNNPLSTNIVENPVTPSTPEKKISENSDAGQGGSAVKEGDKITYSIVYQNYDEIAAAIVIVDKLPIGVDFVSAMDGGKYDDVSHAVTWNILGVPSGESGIVSVVVRVNERAVVKVENSATVQVGVHAATATNIVVNNVTPKEPEKQISEQSKAGQNGRRVKKGDEITYEITYRNNEAAAVAITITDKLPVGVDFVSASNGGRYNDTAHTVVWSLTNIPSGDSGIVSVIVRVNDKAVVMIGNYAIVKVGNNDPQYTNYVENPAGSSNCPEFMVKTKCRKIIKGQKIWDDNDNIGNKRPPSIDIILRKDNKVYKSISISSSGSGVYIFRCLPIYQNSDYEFKYQIDEAYVPDGYTKKLEGYNIINSL